MDVSYLATRAMRKKKIGLLLIWLLQCGLVLSIAYLNPNHFTTVDSGYYLASATNILQGNGHRYAENYRLVWNSIFPMGYPVVIALISFLSGLSVLWASKVVNVLASGVLLVLAWRWFNPNRAILLGCILLLGQFIKLWAHTWSEPLFLCLLLAWAYYFFNFPTRYWPVFFLGMAIMLVRYAGVCIIPLSMVLGLTNMYKKRSTVAKYQIYYSVGWSIFMVLYLGFNSMQNVGILGDDRFKNPISLWDNSLAFAQGLLNEVFLSRDTDFLYFDVLFWIGLALQVSIFIAFFTTRNVYKLKLDRSVHYLLTTSVSYVLFLFSARLISPFDAPTYRLLAPFSFLLLAWLLFIIIPRKEDLKKYQYLGIATILFSWLHLLPQVEINTKLQEVYRMLGL